MEVGVPPLNIACSGPAFKRRHFCFKRNSKFQRVALRRYVLV